nr:YjjG family noncanonical pyrimidine nucleotidase [Paludibacteraceae bacterium]
MKEKIDTTAPQKKTYKAVFLDWDDTIGDWVNAAKQALQDIYATYHLEDLYATFEDYLEAYEPYNLMLWGKYGQNEITKENLQFERFYRPLMIQPEPTLRGRSKEEIAKEIGVEFLRLTNRYFSLLPDADVVVRQLAAKYPLTIISNGFGEVQYYKLAHSGLQDLFTHLLISEEVGINKPQPEIFRIALERNGVTADEAVMIGDSYNSDIAGAKAAGIDQIWIHQGETGETATYIVPTLKDVLKLL